MNTCNAVVQGIDNCSCPTKAGRMKNPDSDGEGAYWYRETDAHPPYFRSSEETIDHPNRECEGRFLFLYYRLFPVWDKTISNPENSASKPTYKTGYRALLKISICLN
jgi:hypothetical protein